MKKIGFLSFGHWSASPYSQVRSAADALIQSIELAEAVEDLGADGAYFRVHHFAQQLGSPFPLLAAAGARTKRIEIGSAGIDMRYENPLYMAQDAGAAGLIAGGGPQPRAPRRPRPQRRRGAPARHQPGLTRAGDRWLAVLRLPAGRRQDRRRHGAGSRR